MGFCFVPRDWHRPLRLPTIIIVPGGTGFLSLPKSGDCGQGLIELAKKFSANGFVACVYDGRGQGSSEGVRSGHDLAIEDLLAALAYLRETCDAVDSQRIGLLGQSLGAMAATVVAAKDSGIQSVILWGMLPRYSKWKQDLETRGDQTMQELWKQAQVDPAWQGKTIANFIDGFRTYDPIDFISQVRQPIMLAGGSADSDYFLPQQQNELVDATASERVVFLKVKGEPHRIRHWSPPFPIIASIFTAWFTETL
jgi:dienelactone hydrolase